MFKAGDIVLDKDAFELAKTLSKIKLYDEKLYSELVRLSDNSLELKMIRDGFYFNNSSEMRG